MSSLVEEVRTGKQMPSHASARNLRLAAGVSATRMAKELGVHRVTLSRWESGLRRPRHEDMRRWAQLLRELYEALA